MNHTDGELHSTLLLLRLSGVGPGRYWKLRQHFGSSTEIIHTPLSQLSGILSDEACEQLRLYLNNHPNDVEDKVNADIELLSKGDVQLVLFGSENYPQLLAEIDQPPPLLYVRGNINNLSLPQIAVVGSRNPTATGQENALSFSRQLASSGFAITSGLALGIDGAAHRGALAADGKTVAVFGTGVDRIYPRRHQSLAEEIVARGGTLVSEFPLGTTPQASHFPRRNRLISGMSLGVLVVEAAVKSGSLITAKYALQQGREVFAIPGSIHNPLSKGCNSIIRQGALLVEQVQDMQEALQGLLSFKWEEIQQNNRNDEQQVEPGVQLQDNEPLILASVGYEPTSIDMLSERTQLATGYILAGLMSLELKGLIEQRGGNYQRVAAVTKTSTSRLSEA